MTQLRLLGGRYELDGLVGRGGMAEVFRARDNRLDRIVGVKTLRDDLARDQAFQARFRREAQSAAQRYQSAADMRDDIRRALCGDPVAVAQRRAWPWVALALVIAVLAMSILGIEYLTGSHNGVGVPSVAGMSLVTAENAITGAGLRAGTVSYKPSASRARNDVISTNPSYGTQVSKGSAVNLVVSRGPAPVAGHSRKRHGHSASRTPTAPSSPGTSSPAPSPTLPSPNPSTSCAVNILGICVSS